MEPWEFLIEIGQREAHGYRLRVVAPGVDQSTHADIDPDDPSLRPLLSAITSHLHASSADIRHDPGSPAEAALRQVGTHLFRALMVDEVPGRLGSVLDRTLADGRRLRIALRIGPAELQALPWELMYDPRQQLDEFLGETAMLVRRLENVGAAIPPLPVTGPLRILGISASPTDKTPLAAVEGERAALTTALAEMIEAGQVELEWAAPTREHVQAQLRRGPWHVLHFIGHGGFDTAGNQGYLLLCGPDGRSDALSARDLTNMCRDQRTLRLVMLNACQSAHGNGVDPYSSMAASLVRAKVAAVVAMQHPITDKAAGAFTGPFYQGFAEGKAADLCMGYGRRGIAEKIRGSLEWSTPVLYLSSSDGQIFVRGAAEQDVAAPTDEDLVTPVPRAPLAVAAASPWRDAYQLTTVTASGSLVRRWWNEQKGWQDPETTESPTPVADVSVFSRAEARMNCVVADRHGRVRHSAFHDERWDDWHSMHAPDATPQGVRIASPEVTRLAAYSSAPGHAEIFAVTAAGELVHRWHWSADPEAELSWSEWHVFETETLVVDVACTSRLPDVKLCVVADVHGRVWRVDHEDGGWSSWHRMRLPDETRSLRIVRVAAGSLTAGHHEVFAVTAEGELIHRYQWEGSSWSPWARFPVPDRVVDVATVTRRNGPYECFIVDAGGRTWSSRFDNDTYWSSWNCVDDQN